MQRVSCWMILLLGIGACSKASQDAPAQDSRRLFATSFEEMDGWVAPNPSLTTEKAHTGQYSVKVDPTTEFSLTYSKELARLSPDRVNKVRLSGWGFVSQAGEKAGLVFQITGPEQNAQPLFYEKIDLTEVGEWSQVSKVLTLPATLDPASKVSVYLWRGQAPGVVYLDDISLTVEP